MCWKCDHPESTDEEWLDAIRDLVVKRGWAVQVVEDDTVPFAYTVGLHERGLPELLVTGLPGRRATRLLNSAAAYLLDGGRPVPGESISFTGGPLVEVVQVEHPDAHMYVAAAFYGPDLRALQLVWVDDRGHSPWCPGFRNGPVRQPVLGVRAAVRS